MKYISLLLIFATCPAYAYDAQDSYMRNSEMQNQQMYVQGQQQDMQFQMQQQQEAVQRQMDQQQEQLNAIQNSTPQYSYPIER